MTLTVKIFLHVKNILTGISYYFVYNLMKKYEHIPIVCTSLVVGPTFLLHHYIKKTSIGFKSLENSIYPNKKNI